MFGIERLDSGMGPGPTGSRAQPSHVPDMWVQPGTVRVPRSLPVLSGGALLDTFPQALGQS